MSRHHKSVIETPKSRGNRGATPRGGRKRLNKSGARAKGTGQSRAVGSVRKERVSRAKKLLEDAQYPSDEVVESVAKLLARNWRRLRKVTGQTPS